MTASDQINSKDLIFPAFITALWATVFGVVISALPVLLIWTLGASGAGSLAAAIKASLLAWPATHGTPILITSVRIDILPFLMVCFPLFLLRRAAVRIFRVVEPTRSVLLAVGIPILIVNAIVSFMITWLASDEVIGLDPIAAVLLAILVAGLAVSWAAGSTYGWPKLNLPVSIKYGLRSAMLLSAILILLSLGLAVARLVINLPAAVEVAGSIADTRIEHMLVWLLTLGYLPVAASWGLAWLLGPGVATGVDTASSFAVVDQAALPALPWLAALPATTVQNGWYLLIVPAVLAGFFALLLWWSVHNESYRVIFTNVLVAISSITFVVLVLSLIGGGAIGPGRLTVFGPQWLPMIGGVGVTIAPAFVLLLILELLRRWISNWLSKRKHA